MADDNPDLTEEAHAASNLAGPITLALLILIAVIAIRQSAPPAVIDASAPATEFSAVRAMRDVREIAQKPRPLGSAENDRVRGYLAARLRELGLGVEVQTATVSRHTEFGPDKWAVINNLIANIPGTRPTATILMVAHYDSVPSGPGAADNAASVAAILETIRALKAGPPLRNDLIVVFTDGEEIGRLGAQAFVEQKPTLRKSKVVVLNFAMRGDEGRSIMFQPQPQDLWNMDQLPTAAPFPRRTSFSPLLFPAPPRETDLNVFLDAGMDGMTFGALRGVTRFHTELDNTDLLDLRSLQDQGIHALSMAQRLGTIDLNDLGTESAASFIGQESQSPAWMRILSGILVPLLLLGLIWIGIQSGHFSLRGVVAGFAIYAIAIVLAVVEARAAWRLTATVAGWRMLPAGTTYGGFYNSVGTIALVFGTLWAAYSVIGRSIRLLDLGAGALVVWMVAAIALAIATPGGLHPFVWPLLFATLAIRFGADAGGIRSPIRRAILALIAAAPATMIIAPSLAGSADGTQLFTIFGGLAGTLLFGWLIPYIDFLTSGRRWMVPAALGAIAIAMFVTGDLASNFDASHPHPDSMFYFLDTDLGHARWVSLDSRPDRFTAQFFQHHVRGGWMSRLSGLTTRDTPTESIPDIARYRDFAFLNRGRTTEGDAPLIDAPPPTLKVLDDSTVAGTRTVKMHIASARGAPVMWMSVPIGVTILRSSIDGKSPGNRVTDGWTGWYWHAPASGFDLELKLATPAPFVVTVIDQTDGLPVTPGFTFKPRTADVMPTPFLFFDSTTLVRKSFAIGGEQMTKR